MRWLCLDIEHDDPVDLNSKGYDLITIRLMHSFVGDRTRVDGWHGAAIWCGHGVFAHNLIKIATLAG